jgi:serine/threonine protein kinase
MPELGRGVYGRVRSGEEPGTARKVSSMRLNRDVEFDIGPLLRDALVLESAALVGLTGVPRLVDQTFVAEGNDSIRLDTVMQAYAGDLSRLYMPPRAPVSEDTIRFLGGSILRAMEDLQQVTGPMACHFDLKPENILMDMRDLCCVVTDFNLTQSVMGTLANDVVTATYRPLWMLQKGATWDRNDISVTHRNVDAWSFAVTMLILAQALPREVTAFLRVETIVDFVDRTVRHCATHAGSERPRHNKLYAFAKWVFEAATLPSPQEMRRHPYWSLDGVSMALVREELGEIFPPAGKSRKRSRDTRDRDTRDRDTRDRDPEESAAAGGGGGERSTTTSFECVRRDLDRAYDMFVLHRAVRDAADILVEAMLEAMPEWSAGSVARTALVYALAWFGGEIQYPLISPKCTLTHTHGASVADACNAMLAFVRRSRLTPRAVTERLLQRYSSRWTEESAASKSPSEEPASSRA